LGRPIIPSDVPEVIVDTICYVLSNALGGAFLFAAVLSLRNLMARA
jgi:hypothetical protein